MNKNIEELKKIEDKIFKTDIKKLDEKALTYMMEKIIHCEILILEGFILILEGFEKRLKKIEILKKGGKYEQMWEEFKRIEGCNIAIYPTSRDKHKPTIEKDMNSIEQKYLPETVKKTITFTIEAETLDNLGEAINDFEMFWAGYNEIKGHCIKYRYGKEGD